MSATTTCIPFTYQSKSNYLCLKCSFTPSIMFICVIEWLLCFFKDEPSKAESEQWSFVWKILRWSFLKRMNKDWLTWSLPNLSVTWSWRPTHQQLTQKSICTSRSTVEWLQEKERYRCCMLHLMFQVQKAQVAKQRSKRTQPKLPSLQNHRLV